MFFKSLLIFYFLLILFLVILSEAMDSAWDYAKTLRETFARLPLAPFGRRMLAFGSTKNTFLRVAQNDTIQCFVLVTYFLNGL